MLQHPCKTCHNGSEKDPDVDSTGPILTRRFCIVIQIRWKFNYVLIQIVVKWSLWNFAHDTTSVLSWHGQFFFSDMITYDVVILKPIFHRIWITKKSFVKWAPALYSNVWKVIFSQYNQTSVHLSKISVYTNVSTESRFQLENIYLDLNDTRFCEPFRDTLGKGYNDIIMTLVKNWL